MRCQDDCYRMNESDKECSHYPSEIWAVKANWPYWLVLIPNEILWQSVLINRVLLFKRPMISLIFSFVDVSKMLAYLFWNDVYFTYIIMLKHQQELTTIRSVLLWILSKRLMLRLWSDAYEYQHCLKLKNLSFLHLNSNKTKYNIIGVGEY